MPAPSVDDWLAADPDDTSRAELAALAETDPDRVAAMFANRLVFGTAGIRGPQGVGPAQMNRVTVRRLAVGIAGWMSEGQLAVVGYDARANSDVFAADVAAVFSQAGIAVRLLPAPLPTPVLAFAVRELDADVGVMVTASHNPPADNGCKVYLQGGAQLRAPIDAEIDALIESAELPAADLAAVPELVETLDHGIVDAYVQAMAPMGHTVGDAPVVAYTAMHGVGSATLRGAFAEAGLAAPVVVAAQDAPDPAFPTVPFPNPEEPGAMDLLLETADAAGASVALANDPDADRLAAAIPDNGRWRPLTGDEVGALLCAWALDRTTGPDRLVVSTVVCSDLVRKIAEAAGAAHRTTLTGFKWIMAAAYEDPTLQPVFAYEEALGYAMSARVRDKDGISAALAFVAMTADLAADGRSVADRLIELSLEHGVHTTHAASLRFDGAHATAAREVVDRLRSDPPTEVAGRPVQQLRDYRNGLDGLPAADMIRLDLDGDARIVVRPSGTEPKAKLYLEQVTLVSAASEVATARAAATSSLTDLAEALSSRLTG